MTKSGRSIFISFLTLIISCSLFSVSSYGKKPFTHDDAMKFKSIRSSIISNDGKRVAYSVYPDRGDGNVFIKNLLDTFSYVLPRGDKPVFSGNGLFIAAVQLPKSIDLDNAKTPKDKPKNGMILMKLPFGKSDEFQNIQKFEFTNDSKWLIYQKFNDENDKNEKMKKKTIGAELTIRHLVTGTEIKVPYVNEYLLDSNSKFIFYAVSSPDGKKDGVYKRELGEDFIPEAAINLSEKNFFSSLAWCMKTNTLAYISSSLRKDGRTDEGSILLWERYNPDLTQFAVTSSSVKKNVYIPADNKLQWTENGEKLFFGLKPVAEKDTAEFEDIKFNDTTYYNADSILANSDDLIWHWNDPRISTNQINWWGKNKNRTFTSVYDKTKKTFFQLADETIPDVEYSDNSDFTISNDETPYLKQSTWGGWYYDVYVFNLNTGVKTKIAENLIEPAQLSPLGKHVVYFKEKHWYIYDTETGKNSNITKSINVPFYNVENDIPMEAGSYGLAGWFENDRYVLINQRYDIFKFFLEDPGSFINATATMGIKFKIVFRLTDVKTDRKVFKERDTVYMNGYSEELKTNNLFFLETQISGGINLSVENGFGFMEGKNYFIKAKSKNADKILYVKESFDEFPDLWVSGLLNDSAKKITDVNPEMKDFKWGTTEKVKWLSPVGDSLDGYIIKPDGFDSKKKYPVLVYFYEKFSDQTYRFYQPRINHRPIYQVYLGEDYVVFVPDIKYKTGRPGMDALEAIQSGLKVLIDSGIADPAKLCIQGHSWAAYQTAYIITQTDMFAAAAAGAPVGNMTSAYSQIRTESGLARQFQYEKYQSRIGGNLWDSLDSYLRNSPVMQAQKITTPLLILHGDADEAVPFSQGVELYLAMRRLNKNCVLVEYKNEPHHPKKYENKLDWAVKMKEWFDHYVLGKPAAKWITEGRTYMGNK